MNDVPGTWRQFCDWCNSVRTKKVCEACGRETYIICVGCGDRTNKPHECRTVSIPPSFPKSKPEDQKPIEKTFLTKTQLNQLVTAFAKAREKRGIIHEEEIQCLISWAEKTIVNQLMLQKVLNGTMLIDWKDDEPIFGIPKTK